MVDVHMRAFTMSRNSFLSHLIKKSRKCNWSVLKLCAPGGEGDRPFWWTITRADGYDVVVGFSHSRLRDQTVLRLAAEQML